MSLALAASMDGINSNEIVTDLTDDKPVIEAVLRPEPTSGDITKIQFRLAGIYNDNIDGSRVIRKFLKEDKVVRLFEYIKATVPEAAEKDFDVIFAC